MHCIAGRNGISKKSDFLTFLLMEQSLQQKNNKIVCCMNTIVPAAAGVGRHHHLFMSPCHSNSGVPKRCILRQSNAKVFLQYNLCWIWCTHVSCYDRFQHICCSKSGLCINKLDTFIFPLLKRKHWLHFQTYQKWPSSSFTTIWRNITCFQILQFLCLVPGNDEETLQMIFLDNLRGAQFCSCCMFYVCVNCSLNFSGVPHQKVAFIKEKQEESMCASEKIIKNALEANFVEIDTLGTFAWDARKDAVFFFWSR